MDTRNIKITAPAGLQDSLDHLTDLPATHEALKQATGDMERQVKGYLDSFKKTGRLERSLRVLENDINFESVIAFGEGIVYSELAVSRHPIDGLIQDLETTFEDTIDEGITRDMQG